MGTVAQVPAERRRGFDVDDFAEFRSSLPVGAQHVGSIGLMYPWTKYSPATAFAQCWHLLSRHVEGKVTEFPGRTPGTNRPLVRRFHAYTRNGMLAEKLNCVRGSTTVTHPRPADFSCNCRVDPDSYPIRFIHVVRHWTGYNQPLVFGESSGSPSSQLDSTATPHSFLILSFRPTTTYGSLGPYNDHTRMESHR